MARVSASCSYKVNMGNYESAAVDVVVSVPCLMEELGEAFEFAYNFAAVKVGEVRGLLKEEAKRRADERLRLGSAGVA